MGMFDFLKKKRPIEEGVRPESFEDAKKIFKEKSEVLKGESEEILIEIKGNFGDFYVSIGEKLKVLGEIDIESKREHGKALILVRQGLDNYIDSVRVLLKDLKKLEKNDFGKFVREISGVFILFEKRSFNFYERATYLIGEEMAAVRNEIRGFYKVLLGVFEREKLLVGNLKVVEEVGLKLGEIERLGGDLRNLGGEILVNNKMINGAKGEVKRLNDEIKIIKNSSEYISNLTVKEKVRVFEVKLNDEIAKLKNLVDFKKLIGIVHVNEKELKVVKEYRDHFALKFSHDEGKLLDLLDRSEMKSGEIETQVLLIKKLRGEVIESKKSVGIDRTIVKLEEIGKIKKKIKDIEIGTAKVNQRLKELVLRLDGLKGEVIQIRFGD
jgi:hypothetical protein